MLGMGAQVDRLTRSQPWRFWPLKAQRGTDQYDVEHVILRLVGDAGGRRLAGCSSASVVDAEALRFAITALALSQRPPRCGVVLGSTRASGS